MRAAARPPLRVLAAPLAFALGLALIGCMSGCGPQPAPAPPATAEQNVPSSTAAPGIDFHDNAASSTLSQRGALLQKAVAAALEKPDAATLQAARHAWSALYRAVNDHYLRLALHACALADEATLARLDRWPFYPAFVDALPAWPDSGIVNDPTLRLTAAELLRQQGATDDGEIALGFQPLWLLLAGVQAAPREPADLLVAVNDNIERRRTYVRLVTARIITDLAALKVASADVNDLHCALTRLDRRLQRLATYHDANDPAAGLYLAEHSAALMAASQPAAALTQLSSEENAALRAALERHYPGFRKALRSAVDKADWAPLAAWLAAT